MNRIDLKIDEICDGKTIYLRSLDPTLDSMINYLDWMRDSLNNPYISSINPNYTIIDLRRYILDHNKSGESILLGIFLKENDNHIGNIKFEPINLEEKHCYLGIMIGDLSSRNKGFGQDAINVGIDLLQTRFGIQKFYLGVSTDNLPAVKLYTNVGFRSVKLDLEKKSMTMLREI